MVLTFDPHRNRTIAQLRAVADGTERLELRMTSRAEAYDFIATTLTRLDYFDLGRPDMGVVRQHLMQVTGLSRTQMTRLIAQHRGTGRLRDRRGPPRNPFRKVYAKQDIRHLAEMDRLHGTRSGAAMRRLCHRAYHLFGDARYERLARISHGHLYNLRRSEMYQRRRVRAEKTRSTPGRGIGERRKPQPEGRPGFLRLDTVHQGDRDGCKGIYLINAVDEVTQCQYIGATRAISEPFLLPVLEALLLRFPFEIRGFHADNGSEFVNREVAALLKEPNVEEHTRSRPRDSNDNALAESRNA